MSDFFSKNYYEIFKLPVQFEIDIEHLKQVYRDLQKEVHPDKFVSAGDQQSRLAMQMTSQVNQAFDTLKSPVLRSQYLLKLAGLDIDHEQETTMDPIFLMEQMALREEIEAVRNQPDPLEAVDKLLATIKANQAEVMKAFDLAYQQENLTAAQEWSRKMQFLNKNVLELNEVAEAIEDELLG